MTITVTVAVGIATAPSQFPRFRDRLVVVSPKSSSGGIRVSVAINVGCFSLQVAGCTCGLGWIAIHLAGVVLFAVDAKSTVRTSEKKARTVV